MSPPTNNWGVKTNRTLFLYGNRKGHHSMELKMWQTHNRTK